MIKHNKIESPNKERLKTTNFQNNEIPEDIHSSESISNNKAGNESAKSVYGSENQAENDHYEIFLNQQSDNLQHKATISVLGDNIHQERIENNVKHGSQTFLQIRLKHRVHSSHEEDFCTSNNNHGRSRSFDHKS